MPARFAAHDLVKTDPVLVEGIGAAGEVDVPDAEALVASQLAHLVCVILKVFGPDGASAGVMAAQVFHVICLQLAFLHRMQHLPDMGQFAMGENVLLDELSATIRRFAVIRIGRRDPVIHREAVVGQQLVDNPEVFHKVFDAHVLKHADAGDAVEAAAHVAVILQANLDEAGKPGGLHAFLRQRELVFAQCDANAARAVLLRGADHQCAPAAADIEQGLSRLQPDLRQDMVDLLDLRGSQVLVAILEVGAGIHHVRVEELLVELVGNVVVVADRFRIALAVMVEAARDAGQAAAVFQRAARECVDHFDHVDGAPGYFDGAFNVGRAQAGKRRFEQVARRGRAGNADRHARRFLREVEAAAIPQLYPQGQGDLRGNAADPAIDAVLYKHAPAPSL